MPFMRVLQFSSVQSYAALTAAIALAQTTMSATSSTPCVTNMGTMQPRFDGWSNLDQTCTINGAMPSATRGSTEPAKSTGLNVRHAALTAAIALAQTAPSCLSPPIQAWILAKRARRMPRPCLPPPKRAAENFGDFGGKNALRTLMRCVKLRQVCLISYEHVVMQEIVCE